MMTPTISDLVKSCIKLRLLALIYYLPSECVMDYFKHALKNDTRYPDCTSPWTQAVINMQNYTDSRPCSSEEAKEEMILHASNLDFIINGKDSPCPGN